ncbi:MAG: hypothetical protein QXU13_04650 [Desulfurococcaceae archaeon]
MKKPWLYVIRKLLLGSLVMSVIYSIILITTVYLLEFPGLGVVFMPQPFLRLIIGRWTMVYDFTDISMIPWFAYILALHFSVYFYIIVVKNLQRPYFPGSALIYFANVVLVLIGLGNPDLKYLVIKHTIGEAGFLPGGALTICIEWLGHKLVKNHIPRGVFEELKLRENF